MGAGGEASEAGRPVLVPPPARARMEAAAAVVEEMRARVFQATGLRCSAGLAPTRMLAKVGIGRAPGMRLRATC